MNVVTEQKPFRLFEAVACASNPAILALLDELTCLGEDPSTKLRAVPPADLHMTLKFFGSVSTDRIPHITTAMDQLTRPHYAFQCQLQGLECFRSAIWMDIRQDTSLVSLMALAADLNSSLTESGFAHEKKPFLRHVTVARLGHNAKVKLSSILKAHQGEVWAPLPVTSLHLYRSETLPAGARFSILHSAALSKPDVR